MNRALLLVVAAGLTGLLVAPPIPSHASDELTWDPTVEIDSGDLDVSDDSALGVINHSGEWHVAYAKAGEIWHAVFDGTIWSTPEPLTTDPGVSRAPKLADAAELHVVWEDDRTGHIETWTRRWTGAAWTPEECLSCDEIPSVRPAIGAMNGDAMVAWEEDPGPTSSILSRRFDGAWQPVEPMSSSPAAAREPTVAAHSSTAFSVLWSDTRHGEGEIYHRFSWQAQEGRVTDMEGDCRRPSAHTEWVISDIPEAWVFVAFEHPAFYHDIEIFAGGFLETGPLPIQPEMLSSSDNATSIRPVFHGNLYPYYDCWAFGRSRHDYVVSWTAFPEEGEQSHWISRLVWPSRPDTLGSPGRGFPAVAAIEGEPDAETVPVWIEEREGMLSLVSKLGRATGCQTVVASTATPLVIAPQGVPLNRLTLVNGCSGEYEMDLGSNSYYLRVSDTLAGLLTWDEGHSPPTELDIDYFTGEIEFELRGGGCSEVGTATVDCSPDYVHTWNGAKSPDVNGDCIVDPGDRDYVTGALGTADFCADLDGSGLVDAADVAIVDATMWDMCSTVDVPAGVTPVTPRVEVVPNPSRGGVAIRLRAPEATPSSVRVMDVSGRVVFDFGARFLAAGATTLVWDGRDGMGRRVAPGRYFALAEIAGRKLRQEMVLVR